MKKQSIKRMIAIVLTAMMSVSLLSACGDKNADSSAPASSKNESSVSSTASDASDSESDGVSGDDTAVADAFESEVTLRVPVYDRGVEGVPTVNNNYWTNWMQENFGDENNIKLEYVPINRSDVMTDYALLASSKSLPTILMEYDYPKVSQWAADGYLTTYDMDEFAAVAPTYHGVMVDKGLIDYSEISGETYFALAESPYWDTAFTYVDFVRMDWLREVGYDYVPVETDDYDDYITAVTKIKEAGIAEYPLGGQMVGVGSDQNYSFREFPQDETEWAMYSNAVMPSLGWEPDYKLLKRENEKYNAGLTNPEYYITDAESAKAAFINGESYRYGGYLSASIEWITSFYQQNPDAELAIQPVAKTGDEKNGTTPLYRANNPFGMIIGFSSTASEDEIKAAWMYMEWMAQDDVRFTMQWGIEDENYVVNPDSGLPESIGDYEGEYKQGYNNNKDYWCISRESRNVGTVEDMIDSIVPKGQPQDFSEGVLELYNDKLKLSGEGYATNDPFFSVVLESEVEYGTSIVELYKEYRDKLVMCKTEEFDAMYEDLSQKYADQGYEAITTERKEAYEAGNSTKLKK